MIIISEYVQCNTVDKLQELYRLYPSRCLRLRFFYYLCRVPIYYYVMLWQMLFVKCQAARYWVSLLVHGYSSLLFCFTIFVWNETFHEFLFAVLLANLNGELFRNVLSSNSLYITGDHVLKFSYVRNYKFS